MLGMEQVAAVLRDAGAGLYGKTLFAYEMPAACRSGLVVMQGGVGEGIDHELPSWERQAFQVIARSPGIAAGFPLIQAAVTALTWQLPRTLPAVGNYPAMLVRRCLPRHNPIIYPRTDTDLYEFSVNFDYVAHPA